MILGIDPGTRRIGVAIADRETRFARPLEVIDVSAGDAPARIAELVAENGIDLVVVGRPTSLRGDAGPSAEAAAGFVATLRERLSVEVTEHDERLTTVLADQGLRAGGAGRKARDGIRDAVAAQVMLQGFLDGGGG